MEKIEFSRLNLVSPLYYTADEMSDPFGYREGDGEKIVCFELGEARAAAFEPDRADFLGDAVFMGRAADAGGTAAGGTAARGEDRRSLWELPRGAYLFAQKRELLSREDIVGMAAEMQQEGLWQRLRLGRRIYLRWLFEDGRSVTQLFRPFAQP